MNIGKTPVIVATSSDPICYDEEHKTLPTR
jgi:hypothetical protein